MSSQSGTVAGRSGRIGAVDPAIRWMRGMDRAGPIAVLHSGRRSPRWATRSVLAEPRAWFRYIAERGVGRSELIDAATGAPHEASGVLGGGLWRDLRAVLNHPALGGRWIGWFGYDVGRLIEPGKLGGLGACGEGPVPLVELGWCPDAIETPAIDPPHSREPIIGRAGELLDGPTANMTRGGYEARVRRALGYIAAGDVFQVNLAQRFNALWRGDPRRLYERLATVSPAWYGAYLDLPDTDADGAFRPAGGRAICSTSPELLLEMHGRGVVTRPIKGTRPVGGAHGGGDARRRLFESAKDAAELTMIVDLMRNDLGRVCGYGSVVVSEPRVIETHPTVHHGVATIGGVLHPSRDVVDLLRATLPGGSVTGAPKVRAMQIIDELEPDRRGPYCGAIGMIGRDELCLSVAIRTMVLESCDAGVHAQDLDPVYDVRYSVGAGIVADSDPAAEFDETLAKAAAIARALGAGADGGGGRGFGRSV